MKTYCLQIIGLWSEFFEPNFDPNYLNLKGILNWIIVCEQTILGFNK